MAEGLPAFGEAAPGDHLQTGYNLWLVGHQLEEGRTPWRDPYSFQPEAEPRWNLAGWPYGYVYWPLERALGTVLAWNAFVLLGFLGAGGLAALWLGELGLRRGAALTGGLAFALAPYLQAQWSAGHLLAWSALLLPVSLYALERARRGSLWWLVLAGAALASIPLSGQLHLSLAAITFFCGYALVRFRWAALLGAPAVAAGLVAYVLAVRDTTGASGRQFRQVEHFSASASDFFSRNTDDLEQVVYPDDHRRPRARRAHRPRLAAATRPRPGPRPGCCRPDPLRARIAPARVREGLAPSAGLHHTRVPERLMPVASLALAALLAIALSRLPWPGIAAMAALLLVVELPLGMFNETAADENNGAYAALRERPPGRMLELPVFRSGEQLASTYLYYLTQAPREHPSGYSTTAPREADRELLALRQSPCRDLPLLGVRYLVVHYGQANPCGGTLLARDGPVASYRLR